jgi:PAS domain-containing protein
MNTSRIQLAPAFKRLATLQRRIQMRPDTRVQEAVDELLRALEELRAGQAQVLVQREEIELLRAELRAERETYSQLLDCAPDPYLITDAQLIILSANRAGAELLNISQRFLAGKALDVFVSKDRSRFVADAARLAKEGESARWTFALRPRERATLAVEAQVAANVTPDGLEIHWILHPAGPAVQARAR